MITEEQVDINPITAVEIEPSGPELSNTTASTEHPEAEAMITSGSLPPSNGTSAPSSVVTSSAHIGQETVNILMVDDRPENLIALEATLDELTRDEGTPYQLNLVRASSGNEALRYLLRDEFAVILLDVQMPGMDGYETAALIRQRPQSQHTPIIFLTAINKSEMNVFKGYSLGAVDYLFKPYEPLVLRAKVSVFIDLYRKSREIQRMADEAQQQAHLLRTSNDELGKTNKIMGGLYRELERKSTELAHERDLIDKIFETAGNYILMFDLEGNLERFNKASEDLFGYSLEELEKKRAWDLLVTESAGSPVKDAFDKLLAGETSVCFDLQVQNRNGKRHRLSMTFTILSDDRNTPIGVIAAGIDVTERYEAEEKMKRMNEELEQRVLNRTRELSSTNSELEREVVERRKAEAALKLAKESAEFANSAKDQFLAVLSHELRTPLTPVLAIVQMLDEDPALPDELRSWVQTIGRNVQLEARLIDDLLDLTRISNGKLQLNKTAVEPHTLINETIAICQEDIKHKCLAVDLELKASETVVEADPARLQQVLWNLLKNAVKFTPEGGSIKVRTESRDGKFICTVTDTGIGIPKESLARVFNAFDQGDKTITRRFGGLGLGLAISKALIDQHGGEITAHSNGANTGSTFTITLELLDRPAEVPKASKPAKSKPKSPDRDTVGPTIQSTGRILLVEDNDDTSQALQVLLERKGFTVISAHSIGAALEIAKTYHCDLLISDIGLPDGTGIDMIRKLNLIRPTRGIAMSGFGMQEDIQRSLDAGFQVHLVKPVNFEQLNEAVQNLLVST